MAQQQPNGGRRRPQQAQCIGSNAAPDRRARSACPTATTRSTSTVPTRQPANRPADRHAHLICVASRSNGERQLERLYRPGQSSSPAIVRSGQNSGVAAEATEQHETVSASAAHAHSDYPTWDDLAEVKSTNYSQAWNFDRRLREVETRLQKIEARDHHHAEPDDVLQPPSLPGFSGYGSAASRSSASTPSGQDDLSCSLQPRHYTEPVRPDGTRGPPPSIPAPLHLSHLASSSDNAQRSISPGESLRPSAPPPTASHTSSEARTALPLVDSPVTNPMSSVFRGRKRHGQTERMSPAERARRGNTTRPPWADDSASASSPTPQGTPVPNADLDRARDPRSSICSSSSAESPVVDLHSRHGDQARAPQYEHAQEVALDSHPVAYEVDWDALSSGRSRVQLGPLHPTGVHTCSVDLFVDSATGDPNLSVCVIANAESSSGGGGHGGNHGNWIGRAQVTVKLCHPEASDRILPVSFSVKVNEGMEARTHQQLPHCIADTHTVLSGGFVNNGTLLVEVQIEV
ncbi:serine/arginine repetitive matrix protein 1-like [Sycon ciliatum]|uniref:serine/arginine repetitive matrix protein 1-like n=1 Tax=Sycon ciliatum TaxID=27933 RepID=UPI0031F69612